MGNALLFDFYREPSKQQKMPAGHRATVIQFPGTERATPAAPASVTPEKPKKRKRGNTQAADQRNGLLAKIHIALAELYKKLPHFDEEFYRDELDRRFSLTERGKEKSAAELNLYELEEVRMWLTSLGWKARKGKNRRSAPSTLTHDPTGMSREARMEKIEAMLAEKGRVEGTDMPWGYAVSILKRQTANAPDGQVRSFDAASPQQLDDAIAALYKDAKRRGRRAR